MPSTEQILKVLKNERECIARQSRPLGEMPQCRKDEDGVKLCEYCDLCLSDTEILEVYDFLINGYELLQNEGAESYTIKFRPQTEEPLTEFDATPLSGDYKTVAHNRKFNAKESLKANFGVKQPSKVMKEFWEKDINKFLEKENTAPDVTARSIFNGICPYTNIKCEKWTCNICEVEKRERRLMEGDTD